MAASTVVKTSYGFYVTGGTSATDIITNKVWVKRIVFIPATDADTLTLVDTRQATPIFKTKGATAGVAYPYDVGGENGTPYEGINATLSGANDVLHIHCL